MRLSTRTAAVVAAAASLALAPAGASAKVHPIIAPPSHPAGGCHVRLTLSPRQATSGESVLLSGAYVCGKGEPGSQTAMIYEHVVGVGGYSLVGPATTTSAGSFTFTPPAVVADSAFYAVVNGARSATRPVRVSPIVTAVPPAAEGTAFLTGFAHKIPFNGSVSPEDRGAEVVLQRESDTGTEEWADIQQHVFVQINGKFSFLHRFAVPGDANLRIVVRAHGRFGARGVSDTMSYTVTQTQNPNLTMEASPAPVSFGQPLTLKGVTKAGKGAKVLVTGHTFGGVLTPVGETIAGENGAWELKIPAAVQNTRYDAVSGQYHSAGVYVGVKWDVTPNPVPSTVSSGTLVTFSGTAEPATRTGHPVYLERKNANGSGWHVVNLGFTGEHGAFSIPWYVIGSGKETYRLKIPGDRINVATASAPVEIEVTPAAAGTPVPTIQPTLPH
jgi:hypothetical protein